jgi:hypothetical protein
MELWTCGIILLMQLFVFFLKNRKVKKKSITLNHFYKRKPCESERDEQGMTPPYQPVKVPRIEEVITSTSQPVDVQRIKEDITHTTQPVDVQRIKEDITHTT